MEANCVAYCGLMGGGKTLCTVALIADYLAAGGCVYTNINLQLDEWHSDRYRRDYHGLRWLLARRGWQLQDGQINQLTGDQCEDLMHHISSGTTDRPVLVVLDEALDHFDSLDRGDALRRLRSFLSFIRHCRKYNINLVFVAQEFTQLNNRIRAVCSSIFICRDLAKTRIPGLGIYVPPPWSHYILQCEFDRTGKHLKRKLWQLKTPDLFGSYDTGEVFASFGLLNAKSDYRTKKKKENIKMWIKILVCVQCIALVYLFVCQRNIRHSAGDNIEAVARAVDTSDVGAASNNTEIIYGRIGWVSSVTYGDAAIYRGRLYARGKLSPYGRIMYARRDMIYCLGDGGKETFIVSAGAEHITDQQLYDLRISQWVKALKSESDSEKKLNHSKSNLP